MSTASSYATYDMTLKQLFTIQTSSLDRESLRNQLHKCSVAYVVRTMEHDAYAIRAVLRLFSEHITTLLKP
jgi:hypothetical protein